jgi:hypothetical protein
MTREEYAKLEEEYRQLMATPIPKAKPKPKPALIAVVSPKLAEAAKANPDSVRIAARSEDGTSVFERPRQLERLEVVEVDSRGRPALARRYDVATNSWGEVEFKSGYRQPSGAQHEYDPLATLKA